MRNLRPHADDNLVVFNRPKATGTGRGRCADGAEALRTLGLERPDLILVDINLSGETFGQQLDDMAVIDWLKYNHPHPIKYIIVSCDDPKKHKGRAAAIGALAFVRKPIENELLLAEITRAIGDPPDPGAALIGESRTALSPAANPSSKHR